MIYILAYIVLGISTGVIIRVNGGVSVYTSIACVFTWPLYWFAFVFAHFVGWMPAKCAWCGQSVSGYANKDKWRAHYLDECGRHPLALRVKELYALIDELDAKHTAQRVKAEKLEAELKPWREIKAEMQKRMTENINSAFIFGKPSTPTTTSYPPKPPKDYGRSES